MLHNSSEKGNNFFMNSKPFSTHHKMKPLHKYFLRSGLRYQVHVLLNTRKQLNPQGTGCIR